MATARPATIPPHPLMPDLYRDNAEKKEWLRRIFDETAPDYDRVEGWLSLGSGRWYRRQALRRAGLGPGMRVADVACGTGLLAREALPIVGSGGSVVGIDPSEGMLAEAERCPGLATVTGVADALPLQSETFDFVSMGYALRHVEDLAAAFAEFYRVLKPGGVVCILEITRPEGRVRRAMLRAHLGLVSGVLLRLWPGARRTPELWQYYWRTIERCIPPVQVLEALRGAGFVEARRAVTFGLFSEYTARRASSG
jgi:demethylmenaquinone methyltransferase / 2-methoxy-6-polyprenyl-1,4-benzoquinol methylase